MSYRESLPDGCPPTDAERVSIEKLVYRLVSQIPPQSDDFRSYRAINPYSVIHVTECQAHGLSVYTTAVDCENARKLPRLKGRLICCIRLLPGSGDIQKTGKHSHHTWWPQAAFDIFANCTEEAR
jgi:hypothetical protein